jgi:hypothetical protein
VVPSTDAFACDFQVFVTIEGGSPVSTPGAVRLERRVDRGRSLVVSQERKASREAVVLL